MFLNNIVLIGMPSSGKSTVGIILAKYLCMNFIDTDLIIQKNTGKALQKIIDEDGLERFLEIENKVMINLNCKNTIIATGGSSIFSASGINHLKANSIVVYLEISYPILVKRINNIQTRGIVMRADQNLKDLYDERSPLYEKYSDMKINCDLLTTQECVEKLIEYFTSCFNS